MPLPYQYIITFSPAEAAYERRRRATSGTVDDARGGCCQPAAKVRAVGAVGPDQSRGFGAVRARQPSRVDGGDFRIPAGEDRTDRRRHRQFLAPRTLRRPLAYASRPG